MIFFNNTFIDIMLILEILRKYSDEEHALTQQEIIRLLDMAIAVTFLEKYEPNPRNTELIAMKYDYLDCILEQK